MKSEKEAINRREAHMEEGEMVRGSGGDEGIKSGERGERGESKGISRHDHRTQLMPKL